MAQDLAALRYAQSQIDIFRWRLSFLSLPFCCHTIGGFPPCTRALGDVEILPILIGTGELLGFKYAVYQDDDKRRVHGGVVCAFRFGFGVFDVVYVLGNALTIEMLSLYLVLECEDIEGMEYSECCLEVGKYFPRDDKGIVCLGLFDFADPHVFDSDKNKFTRLLFCGFVVRIIAEAEFLYCLLSRSYRCLHIAPNENIVYFRLSGAGKRGSVILRVSRCVLDYPDKVVDPISSS